MDYYNPEDRTEFLRAVEYHDRRIRQFRRTRARLIRDYAGSMYRDSTFGEARIKQFANLMRQAAESHMLQLAGGEPRFLITSRKTKLAPFAKHFQTAINNLAQEIHLGETIRDIVLDAFFGPGIAKILLADAPLVEVEEDVLMDPGQPFIDRVSLDDFIFDTDASEVRKFSFVGDRYRIPFYLVEEDEIRFDQKVTKNLRPTPRRDIDGDHEEAKAIAFGQTSDDGEFEPYIDLVDIYFPRDKTVVTWAIKSQWDLLNTDPLAIQEWDGDETGPYEILNLGPVPDNVLPSSPAENLKYLFDLVNSVYRKMNNQARRQKTIGIVPPGAEEDVDKIIRANDGEAVVVTDPESVKELALGGVHPANLQFAISAETMADRMAGNLQSKLGLGPSAETASQDRMISGQIGATQQALQEKVVRFVSRLGQHLAWMLFHDPVKEIPGSIRVEGTDYEYDSTWSPDVREGSYSDYEYRVEPYSLAYKSPQERAQTLNQFVQMLLPMMPMLQQQGMSFDFQRFLEIQAELLDAPRLLELFKPGEPTGEPGTPNQATQSPVTQRTQIRRGESSGVNPQQQQQNLLQMMGKQ